MFAPRWLPVLVLAAWIGLAALATEARAQVFRPRTGKGAPALKAAAPGPGAPGSPATAAARKTAPLAAAPAATPSKAPARASAATTPRRTAKKKHGKARGDSDVTIDDEDDEDVKITDD